MSPSSSAACAMNLGRVKPLRWFRAARASKTFVAALRMYSGRAKRLPLIGDVHGSELAGPPVDVLEQVVVERLQMGQVVASWQWAFVQFQETCEAAPELEAGELGWVRDSWEVA
jgi:hypothetical protein